MKDSYFTVVMEFAGTTSVSQFTADEAADALKMWLTRLIQPDAYGLSRSSARQLEKAFADNYHRTLEPVEGLVNVWCTVALVSGKLALLNVVKTCR